nr:lasso peptide biosynthesis B2 protein [Pelomonas sp. P8]
MTEQQNLLACGLAAARLAEALPMLQSAAQSPTYRLADHVRACRVDDQVILLDLERSKYLGIGHARQAGLERAIIDWPAPAGTSQIPPPSADLNSYLKPLLDQGLLTDRGTARPQEATLPVPSESINAALTKQTRPQSLDLLTLAWAAWRARIWMRRSSLADIACRVRRLRPRPLAASETLTVDAMHSAVSSYMGLRPFLFTSHDECLRDSLTMVRFLARKRLYPTWVIGVRIRPFAAHSWVQAGHLVLNDVHENVRRYTPILIV